MGQYSSVDCGVERKDVCVGLEVYCNSTWKGRGGLEEVASKLELEGETDIYWAAEGGRGEHPRAETEQKQYSQELGQTAQWRQSWRPPGLMGNLEASCNS